MQPNSLPTIQRIDLPTWKKYWEHKGFVTDMLVRDMIRIEPPEALNMVFHVGPYFTIVVDYRDMSFQYVKGVENILGFEFNESNKMNLEFLVALVHPEDVQKVLGLSTHYFTFLEQQSPEKRLDFWPSINFRMKKANGDYLRVLEQVICLKIDDQGRVTHALKYFTDISHLNYSNEVVLSVVNTKEQQGQRFYTFNLEEKDIPAKDLVVRADFSDREKEILTLIAAGITSKEVAQKLGLSHHTVNKHRENMMRKTGSKNMNEVISFAYCSDNL